VALAVSPARLAFTAPGSRRVTLRNDGAARAVVDVAQAPAGRGTRYADWLDIAPTHLALRPHEVGLLTVRADRPANAEPGAHQLLVLLTTRPLDGSRVDARLRLGVRVSVRFAGPIVRSLTLGALLVRLHQQVRMILVSVRNRGNVTVPLRGRVTASLLRVGRVPTPLTASSRGALPPGARTTLSLRYRGRLRGALTLVVRVRLAPIRRIVERRYRVRL
jgi:hypothetical protein